MSVMSPVPVMVPVVSPYQDRRKPIHHRRLSHDYGCWLHDDWLRDQDDRRGYDCYRERKPNADGHMDTPRVCGERQDKDCDTQGGHHTNRP